MQIVNRLSMVSVLVGDMKQAKEFYADKLGLAVATDYRRNDDNWWVTLTLPGGGTTITLARSSTTHNEPPEPGALGFYLQLPTSQPRTKSSMKRVSKQVRSGTTCTVRARASSSFSSKTRTVSR